jgi:hypothetical protein
MISSLLAFFSSNAGGALVGLILERMDAKRTDDKEKREFELQKDLAYKNQLHKHNKGLDAAATGKPSTKKTKFELWGLKYEKTRDIIHYPPRALAVVFCLSLLCFTFCSVLLLWAGHPDATIITLNPNAEPTRIGIPWLFMVEFTRENIFILNAGGVVYAMLLAVNFILSTAIVGGVRRALR